MQVVTNVALISINATVVVQLVSFLIFLFIINRIMFRPLQKTMAEREFYIDEMKSDIEDAGVGYAEVSAEIEAKEATVKLAAFKLSQEHEAAGSSTAKEIYEAAQVEIGQLKAKAEAEVEGQIREARKTIQKESEVLAVTIMEKILDRRLQP